MNDSVLDPRLGIGGNLPPEPIDLARESVDALIKNANKWAEDVPIIDSEGLAASCNDVLNKLDAHLKELDEQRIKEKRPHDKAAAAVQAKWKPLLDKLEICKNAIAPLHSAWLRLKEARLKAERETKQREAAEAQRRAEQLAEQAKAGGANVVTNTILGMEAAAEAEKARRAVAAIPQRAQSRGNLGGRTRSLQTVWRAEIIDQDKCYLHFRGRQEVKDILSQLANAAARSGVRNPDLGGCWIFSEDK